ncbi:MAG: bifunctional glycosyltransferase/class I SAM-dependent methyltransferase [bacterium]|nr:bifunctional glycosyltransferase/class I SAM-dependent methyltransferase [bacterium]
MDVLTRQPTKTEKQSTAIRSFDNDQPAQPKPYIIAVLPAFNAEQTLAKTYKAIPKTHVHEVILVDDASSDNTVKVAETIDGLKVVKHRQNKGYGGNQKTCYKEALQHGADIVVMIHPDFQYDPRYVPQMIKPILHQEADFVIGSRFLKQDPREFGMVWWRYWGNRLLTFLQNKILGISLSECHSGYRAYSKQLLESLPFEEFSDSFVFDSEMIASAARQKFRFAEAAIPCRYTNESSSIPFASSVKYGLSTLKTLKPSGSLSPQKCPICSHKTKLFQKGNIKPSVFFKQHQYRISIEDTNKQLPIYRCPSCSHGFTPLNNSFEQLSHLYKYAPLDTVYLSEKVTRQKTARKILSRISANKKPGHLLDIGAGPGFFLNEAKKQGWRVTGIEPSIASASYAEAEFGLTNIQTDNNALAKLDSASFDVIAMLDVIEHHPEPQKLISQAARLLKPDGLFVLTTPRFDSLLAKMMGRSWYCIFPSHLHYFSRKSLAVLLKKHNLSIIKATSHTRYFSLSYLLYRASKHLNAKPSTPNNLLKGKFVIPINLLDEQEIYAAKNRAN